jgi:hypothetical protein
MAQEEPEVSDELRELKGLTDEVSEHTKRIATLNTEGKLADVLADEIASTVMPLFDEFASAKLKHAAMVEDWLNDLDDEVENGGGGDEGPELSKEDMGVLMFNTARYREFIQGAKSTPDAPAELLQAMLELEVKLNEGEKILKRLNEYVEAQEEDEGEDDEAADADAEGADDDGDDTADTDS